MPAKNFAMTGAVSDLGLGADLVQAQQEAVGALRKKRIKRDGMSAAADELGLT